MASPSATPKFRLTGRQSEVYDMVNTVFVRLVDSERKSMAYPMLIQQFQIPHRFFIAPLAAYEIMCFFIPVHTYLYSIVFMEDMDVFGYNMPFVLIVICPLSFLTMLHASTKFGCSKGSPPLRMRSLCGCGKSVLRKSSYPHGIDWLIKSEALLFSLDSSR